jgi:hypothetical protein
MEMADQAKLRTAPAQLSVLITYVPPPTSRDSAVASNAAPRCPLFQGDYTVNEALAGHTFFTHVAHVACLQDPVRPASPPAPTAAPAAPTSVTAVTPPTSGGELALHSLPAASWIGLGGEPTTALYDARIALLNQHVSDGFGKLAARDGMRAVVLGAELVKPFLVSGACVGGGTAVTDVGAAGAAVGAWGDADATPTTAPQVIRLQFSDHLAFMLIALRPSAHRGWSGEALDLTAGVPPLQRRMFGLQLGETPPKQNKHSGGGHPGPGAGAGAGAGGGDALELPTTAQVCNQAFKLQTHPGHDGNPEKAMLTHILTLRLVGSLLSKDLTNVVSDPNLIPAPTPNPNSTPRRSLR